MQYSNKYIFGFTALICLVCSMMISISAVGLRERQERNKLLDKQKSVLQACWLLQPGERVSMAEVEKRFENVESMVIDLESGMPQEGVDPVTFDAATAMRPVESNITQLPELPAQVCVYTQMEGGKAKTLILPIQGKGLWSTLHGFLALDADTKTIRGLTYYLHAETPGLGGEVDNPKWKSKWKGRLAFDDSWNVAIGLKKGGAGSVEEDPYNVDSLSGATLTSRGVENMLQYWLSEDGYGKFLKNYRDGKVAAQPQGSA